MANIYDLTWSPCGEYICTGSIMDNVANIWHVASRTCIALLVQCLKSYILFI